MFDPFTFVFPYFYEKRNKTDDNRNEMRMKHNIQLQTFENIAVDAMAAGRPPLARVSRRSTPGSLAKVCTLATKINENQHPAVSLEEILELCCVWRHEYAEEKTNPPRG